MSEESRARPYHHGDLRQALIDAALAIVEERGTDQVSVREVGARAGVSSAAPFRHFVNKTALMTAIAEESMRRFRSEVANALDACESQEPLDRLRAMGIAYLRWAVRNPTHFEVISTRRNIDFDGSETLVALNDEIRSLMTGFIEQARAQGRLRSADAEMIGVQARALVYGLARMWIDGQFVQWGGEDRADTLMQRALDEYLRLLDPRSAG
ncbi:TetR/AcrR family transcriptional regulator [Caulobacter sp.]|uniref:TetR/AcrR family transcriptional regulator n=1 Tax=Caulobacter sp. TaxID=78 RepID=UPI003BACB645